MDSSCLCTRLCEHCEHVWIAVLGSVKLFPNLEAALKGVFGCWKNLRKASASSRCLHRKTDSRNKCSPFAFQSRASRQPLTHQVFHAEGAKRAQRRHRGRPSNRRPAGIRDRSVTPLRPKPRHDRRPRVPAHRLRVRTSPPNRSNCPRWRASEDCSARAGCSRAVPSRCVLRSETHGGQTLSHTPTRAMRTPS